MTAETKASVCVLPLVGVKRGSGVMRSETNGLRVQTTTSPLLAVKYETLECSLERRRKKKPHAHKVVVFAACWPLPRARSSVSSLRYHDCVGQEPVTGGHPSVDEFWESICLSFRATDLLRAGWNPVFVRHHPDGALLQNQDHPC